jgi:hypothetical protein
MPQPLYLQVADDLESRSSPATSRQAVSCGRKMTSAISCRASRNTVTDATGGGA